MAREEEGAVWFVMKVRCLARAGKTRNVAVEAADGGFERGFPPAAPALGAWWEVVVGV